MKIIEALKNFFKLCKIYDIGEFDDGYHSFNSLYHQRAILFATIVKANKDKSWKTYKHEDGSLCFGGGWFLVTVETPKGNYGYHFSNDYWHYFDCKEIENAKHWDGYTDADVGRLLFLNEYAKFEKEKEIDMDFVKTLQSCSIRYLSEFPSEDIKVEENDVIAVPGKKRGQFNLYTWFKDKWVYTSTVDKSDFELKELEDACADLENAIKRLNKISSNTENDELSSKLSKITTKILQAKYELADDVLKPFKTSDVDK